MKKLFFLLPLVAVVACANTAQGKLRQTVFNLDSAYHLLANPMPDVMAGKVPGVTVSDADKILIKRASQTVFSQLSALETSIEAGNSITETAVSSLQADFSSLTTCWLGAKEGTMPTTCAATFPEVSK
ncbi:hypothetical protein HK15_08845 [Acetobacter orientalis]|uniref:Lipoprotein n=1 Tax=Acetobacter orientalis TaxID=146474 RepID=A0A252BHB1_9PROT|nr:hypothetical protein [Acetobacter orientalis]OUJ03864.1 hypothetical protein HK15_08845 [Acetobacter orientalis]